MLERQQNSLDFGVLDGSYGELWSLKKALLYDFTSGRSGYAF